MLNDECRECGLDIFNIGGSFQPLAPSILRGPKHCTECGQKLWSKCGACNGRGYKDGGYCSSCGKKKANKTCTSCNGSGAIEGLMHLCAKSFNL